MGSRDFYTDDECRAMDAADLYQPGIERRDREIARLNAQVKRLTGELERMRLRLDDALDRADAGGA